MIARRTAPILGSASPDGNSYPSGTRVLIHLQGSGSGALSTKPSHQTSAVRGAYTSDKSYRSICSKSFKASVLHREHRI